MRTFTLGLTPETVIADALPARYHMTLNAGDEEAVRWAIGRARRASAPLAAALGTRRDGAGRLDVELDRTAMLSLLRALGAGLDHPGRLAERALDLRGSVLTTLDIEEI